MAKFGSYYNLCPLSDIKGLQGVSPDKEDGQVIVTYRRNLAIKYRIHDQRQIHSWRTKERFSSPVVWCESLQKYFAVFGERYVRCWNGDEEYLDKLKKHKFDHDIKTLISISNGRQCFMIFANGTVVPIEIVMSQHKETCLPPSNLTGEVQEVMHCTIGNLIYIGMTLTSDDTSFKFAWTSFDCAEEESDSKTFELDRSSAEENVNVVGGAIADVEGAACLLLLWSDGKLFQVNLQTVEASSIDVYGSAFKAFNSSLAMISLGDTQQHIAIFGEASAGEGALLALYGVRTRHLGPTLALKVRGDSRNGGLWHCGGDRLLVHVGQNLVVVPVHLAEQELAHLLGGDENMMDAVELSQVVTQSDVTKAKHMVDLDEDVVVHLVQQALPEAQTILQIISKSAINDHRLTRALRKHLSFTSSIKLFQHLMSFLSEDDVDTLTSITVKDRCVMWSTCLLDANYQQLSIACGDPEVATLLVNCCHVLKTQKMCLKLLRELQPMMEKIVKKSKNRNRENTEDSDRPVVNYSVETLNLY